MSIANMVDVPGQFVSIKSYSFWATPVVSNEYLVW
jgi:hypothetical protein